MSDVFSGWLQEHDLGMKKRFNVASISYGGPEVDNGPKYSEHQKRCNTVAEALTSAGITICISSGDAGSSSTGAGFYYGPSFPANLPAVVSVGATAMRYDPAAKKAVETVSNNLLGDLITSGGGFSSVFDATPEQKKVLDGKLDSYALSRYARPNPDVAAMGSFIFCVIMGQQITVSGTSASSPLFAAMLSLFNNELLIKGKPTLKNVNRWIYQNLSTELADIDPSVGLGCDNDGSRGQDPASQVWPKAWRAEKGFDAVTGFGVMKSWTKTDESAAHWTGGTTTGGSGGQASKLSKNAIIGIACGGGVLLLVVLFFACRKSDGTGQSGETDIQGQYQQAGYGTNERSAHDV